MGQGQRSKEAEGNVGCESVNNEGGQDCRRTDIVECSEEVKLCDVSREFLCTQGKNRGCLYRWTMR
jgi:hypothetical protein